jgi:molybdopterin synthase sulfur carrier subunit
MTSTPTVTLHVLGALREYCGGVERYQAALYRNLCDETGAVRRHLNVFVNADNVRDLNGIDTALKAGDVVTILPAVSGG